MAFFFLLLLSIWWNELVGRAVLDHFDAHSHQSVACFSFSLVTICCRVSIHVEEVWVYVTISDVICRRDKLFLSHRCILFISVYNIYFLNRLFFFHATLMWAEHNYHICYFNQRHLYTHMCVKYEVIQVKGRTFSILSSPLTPIANILQNVFIRLQSTSHRCKFGKKFMRKFILVACYTCCLHLHF